MIDVLPVPPTAPTLIFTPGESIPNNTIILPVFENNIQDHLENDSSKILPRQFRPLPFTYTLTGSNNTALPSWLRFDPNTRVLSSIDPVEGESFEVTYTATEAIAGPNPGDPTTEGPDSASLTFTIIVDRPPVPPLSPPRVFPVYVNRGTSPDFSASYATQLAFSSGNGDLMYELAEDNDIPDGLTLTLDRNTAALSGTFVGTAMDDSTPTPLQFTYTATDEDGDVVSATFTVSIFDQIVLFVDHDFIPVEPIGDIHAIEDSAIMHGPLPEVINNAFFGTGGGTGTVTYSIEGVNGATLPEGLTFTPNDRMITGTPTETLAAPNNMFNYIATDEDGDTDTLPFTITVDADTQPVPPSAPPPLTFAVGEELSSSIRTLTASQFAFSGGNGDLTYALAAGTTLPQGLMLDPNTAGLSGTVRGTPNPDGFTDMVYTYSATDVDGDVETATFTITLTDEVPAFTGKSITDITAVVDSPITAVTLPEVDKNTEDPPEPIGTGTITYSLTPVVSDTIPDLSFDANTRVLSGTPSAVPTPNATNEFTYTAMDEDGDTTTPLTFTITVAAEIDLVTPTIEPIVFVVGQAAQDVSKTLTSFTGGNGMLSYTLSNTQELLDDFGLIFEVDAQNSPMITGNIPADIDGDQSVALMEFTYTATDDDNTPDHAGDDETASTPITIQIVDPIPIEPMTAVVDQTFTIDTGNTYQLTEFNHNITPDLLTDPNITAPTFTYKLRGPNDTDLPGWLSFNENDDLVLSGTPPVDIDENFSVVLTYTATEIGGMDTASATFTLSVTTDPIPQPAIPDNTVFTFFPGDVLTGIPTGEFLPAFTISETTSTLTHSLVVEDDDTNTPVTSLVGGLTYNQETRQIMGTVPATTGPDGALEVYTYSATEVNANLPDGQFISTGMIDITIRIVDEQPVVPDTTPSFTFNVGETLSDQELPPFTGGTLAPPPNDKLTYALNTDDATALGALGLSLDIDPASPTFLQLTGTVTGTPNPDGFTDRVYTYTATDRDLDVTEATFTITLIDEEPNLSGESIPNINGIANSPIITATSPASTTFSLPESTTGTGTVTYRLNGPDSTSLTDPDLPQGLMFNTNTRELSGTPVAALSTNNTYTYTATDEDGDTDTLTFTITVAEDLPPVVPTPAIEPIVFVVGQAEQPNVSEPLTIFTGGNGMLNYTLSDMQVLLDEFGLMFEVDAQNRPMITGDIPADDDTPQSVASMEFTYTATDDENTDTNIGDFTATDDDNSVDATISIQIIDPIPVEPMTAVEDQVFTIGEPKTYPLTAFTTNVDDNSGVARPELTYTLTGPNSTPIDPDLPDWVSFDNNPANTSTFLQLSGTPPDDINPNFSVVLTYTATEVGGMDTASDTFTLSVSIDPKPMVPEIPASGGYSFTQGRNFAIDTFSLPEFTGGDQVNEDLIYSLLDADGNALNPANTLIGGLTFDPSDRSINGTATLSVDDENDNMDTATYTYRAMEHADEDDIPDMQTVMVTITITDVRPDFSNARPIPTINAILNSPITAIQLPETTGTGTVMYEITPTLPAGLTFNANDLRILSGTPTTVPDPATDEFTYTATDTIDESDMLMFTITVADDLMPEMPNVDDLVLVPGQELPLTGANAVTLPEVVGGNGEKTYSLTLSGDTTPVTALVGGLDYNQMTRVISGTIADDSSGNNSIPFGINTPATMYTYTVTDEDDDPASTTFSIRVVDVRPLAPEVRNQTSVIGVPISYQLPAFDDNIPTGLSSDPSYTFTYTLTGPGSTPTDPDLPQGLSFGTDPSNTDTFLLLSGTPTEATDTPITLTYTATEVGGADSDSVDFTIEIFAQPVALTAPIATQAFTLQAGMAFEEDLAVFTGGNGMLTYAIDSSTSPAPPSWLMLNDISDTTATPTISGTIPNTDNDDSVIATTYTYTATDQDSVSLPATFTITVEDNNLEAPEIDNIVLRVGVEYAGVTLDPFRNATSTTEYELELGTLSSQMAFDRDSRMLTVSLPSATPTTPTDGPVTVTYRASTPASISRAEETAQDTFTIQITDAPSLEMATASAIPTVGANIALVASQAISSRVELALDGLSSGIDIRTLDGPSLRLNPQQQNGDSSGSPVRFGVWYSAASDSLSDTRGEVTWEGTTDSTNLGFDVGFDISESASLVVGILQNSSSTSATYRNTTGGSDGTLSVDLDSTAFYVGLGYDWLDAWFANGSADSTLNDSITEMAIPASFSYQTIGLTASFEIIDSLSIGGKVESLTSDLSLTAMENDDRFNGLQTDSSQLRTAFVANYQLKVGLKGNGLLIPKLEFGFRDLSLGTDITDTAIATVAAAGGSAMETGFGIDYLQRAWGLTLGLDIRSISVENYSSDSTQWQIRWESGSYASGLSFGLKPHAVSETLGGIDSLYSNDYNQYQALLERQRGGNDAADTKGMDFEMGYGLVAGYGTITPYLKTTNYRGSGNRAQELGIRYKTLQGLELTVKAERELTPQTIQILGIPLTFMEQENALTFTTRYNF